MREMYKYKIKPLYTKWQSKGGQKELKKNKN